MTFPNPGIDTMSSYLKDQDLSTAIPTNSSFLIGWDAASKTDEDRPQNVHFAINI